MSIDCRCGECSKMIDIGETTVCQKCHNALIDEIAFLEKEVSELQRIIEEAKDE